MLCRLADDEMVVCPTREVMAVMSFFRPGDVMLAQQLSPRRQCALSSTPRYESSERLFQPLMPLGEIRVSKAKTLANDLRYIIFYAKTPSNMTNVEVS